MDREFICYKQGSMHYAPKWISNYSDRSIVIIYTDFNKVYFDYHAVDYDGNIINSCGDIVDKIDFHPNKIRNTDINKIINPKYLSLGMDKAFICNKFERHTWNNWTYQALIEELTYFYAGGRSLSYFNIDMADDYTYINIRVNVEAANMENAKNIYLEHKNKINNFVVLCINNKLKSMGLDIRLNFYKNTNITILRDATLLFQFSIKDIKTLEG